MNENKKVLGLITSIGIAIPLILRTIETYILVFVKIGDVLPLVIHYFLYVASLASISFVFWQFIFQSNKKDNQKIWSLIPSILVPWVIFWDFAFPSTMLPTLTLLKSVFYLIIFIRFSHHISKSSDWIIADRNIYIGLMVATIVNFIGDNLIGSKLYVGDFNNLASILISKAFMSFLAGLLMVGGIFYTNSFLQGKLDKSNLKNIPYASLVLAVFSLFLSILVFYQNAYPVITSWGYSVNFELPESPFFMSHFILFLYLLGMAYVSHSKVKFIDLILSLSFVALFIGLNTEGIVSAGNQAIEFIQGDLATYGIVVSSAVGIIGTVSAIIGLLRRESIKDKKEVTPP